MTIHELYHEEPWLDDRIKRADHYENVPNPQQSNMFVRYLLAIGSEQRVASNRESWRRYRVVIGHTGSHAPDWQAHKFKETRA